MKNSQQWQQVIADLQASVQAIVQVATEENRELSTEEQAVIDRINGSESAKGELAAAIDAKERALKIESVRNQILASQNPQLEPNSQSTPDDVLSRVRVPLSQRNRHDKKIFDDERTAYATGQFLLAAIGGNVHSRRWCDEHGIKLNRNWDVRTAHSEGDNTKGGYLVPEFFETSIIRIVEQYGVFRQNSRVYPMGSDVVTIPRRTGGFTVYYVGENTAITASDMAFGQVRLQAKKPAILTQISSELNEDEVVGLANLLTTEFGYALAVAEDAAGFTGDGTSTYGGIIGLKNAIQAGSVNDAASGNTSFGTLDLADFHNTKAKLPQFAGIQPKWYIHSAGYAASMEVLQVAAGGNVVGNVAGGGQMSFLGAPVVFSQTLLSALTAQVSTICCWYGDLAMATTMGVRRGIRIDSDSSKYFAEDAIAVRATERYDINCHEMGTATAAGPIIALKLAAS